MHFRPATWAFCALSIWRVLASSNAAPKPGGPGERTQPCTSGMAPVSAAPTRTELVYFALERLRLKEALPAKVPQSLRDGYSSTIPQPFSEAPFSSAMSLSIARSANNGVL